MKNRMLPGLLLVLFFVCGSTGFAAQRIVPLPRLVKPGQIVIDGSRLYITDDAAIHIYSLPGFKHITTFGKRGDGPGEFAFDIDIVINVQTRHILVETAAKLSCFTKNGVFVKDVKHLPAHRKFRPLAGGYVGKSGPHTDGYRVMALNLFDADLKKGKEIFRMRFSKLKQKRLFLHTPSDYHVYKDRVYLAAAPEPKIHVFGAEGESLGTLTFDYKRIKVTGAHIDSFFNWVKKYRPRRLYEFLKRQTKFPDYFPAVLEMRVTDDSIYILTYGEKDGRSEFVVLDLKGKQVKRLFVPFERSDPVHVGPFTVYRGELFQLIDNEETESWDLRITQIIKKFATKAQRPQGTPGTRRAPPIIKFFSLVPWCLGGYFLKD